MPLSLYICSDYDYIHVALANQDLVLQTIRIDKRDGNTYLISSIIELLASHQTSMDTIAYIGINVGPAPYTTLRTALATMNGLARARNIPLVEVDALKTYLEDYRSRTIDISVAIFNAFNNDVFYGISAFGNETYGCSSVPELLNTLNLLYPGKTIFFCGNVVELHMPTLSATLGACATYDPALITYAPMAALVRAGQKSWAHGITTTYAQPRYLKEIAYQNSVKVT